MDRDDATPEGDVLDRQPAPAAPTDRQPSGGKPPAAPAQEFFDDADEPDSPEQKAATPATWPTDWREKMAGGDEKLLAQLKRMADPTALPKSYKALQQKLSSGEYIRKPPEGASEEELAKFREEIGVPKTALEYEVPEIDGHEWSEADEPYLESLFGELHKVNAPQAQIDAVLGWYGKFVEQGREAQTQRDKEDAERQNDDLRADWGNEFKGNKQVIKMYLNDSNRVPPGMFDALTNARTADGRKLLNLPGVPQWLAGLAKGALGDGGQVYGDARVTATDRLAEIEKIMQTDPHRYWKEGLSDEAMALRRKMGPQT